MRELKIGSLGTYYQHFNLLIQYGYLSAEQRKVSGRFDICIYRLNDTVDLEAPPNPLPTKREKGMSEKPEHGGILLKTDFATSEKPMSEKTVSEKMEYGKPGQAKNNNIVTRNSYFMTEQSYNHQRPPSSTPPRPLFTHEEVRRRLNFAKLQAEAESWGTLMKHTLGLLNTPEEESRYQRVTSELLTELVIQLADTLNRSYQPQAILQKLEGDEFSMLFDDLLGHWDEIRCVSAYVSASLKNLLKQCIPPSFL